MRILVTGAAGFIGYHTAKRLLERGDEVIGLDDLNPYYDPKLKQARLALLEPHRAFTFHRLDLADREGMEELFRAEGIDRVIHLAAQAGVRYSIESPHPYVDANIKGFLHVLEGCRHHEIGHLVYASTSSVYGLNSSQPFSEHEPADHPMALYAATKRANELMAHSYAHLYGIPATGLRFFTVYGPWGRPDMALFKFTRGILAGEKIPVYNRGDMVRDFTYVDDIVEGVIRATDAPARPNPAWDPSNPDPATSSAPWRIYNIGNNRPVPLLRYIEVLEDVLGRKADMELLPIQPGDVPSTMADITDLERDVGFRPGTPIEIGVRRFVEWYREYYGV